MSNSYSWQVTLIIEGNFKRFVGDRRMMPSGTEMTREQSQRVSTYFSRNYKPGERIKIPERSREKRKSPNSNGEGEEDWIEWMRRRLIEIGFYDKHGMRVGETNKIPPRIFLRGDATPEEEERYKIASSGIVMGKALMMNQETLDELLSEVSDLDHFRKAIMTSKIQLQELALSRGNTEANILKFQLSLLEDAELIDPVIKSISDKETCSRAWQKRLDSMIEEFEEESDSYFKARAEDLKDLKQRVLKNLSKKNEDKTTKIEVTKNGDIDPIETKEWLESLNAVVAFSLSISMSASLDSITSPIMPFQSVPAKVLPD